MTGLEGPITIARAAAIASSASGAGRAAATPSNSTPSTGAARASAYQVLLQRPPATGVANSRAHLVVAHREHAAGDAERLAQDAERLRQPRALGQPRRALHAHSEVAVAEVEPHVLAQLSQALHHLEGVVAQAPAALVDAVGQPVDVTRSGSGQTWAP